MTSKSVSAAEFLLEQNAKKGATDALDRAAAMEKNMTPNGKTMIVRKVANTALYRLDWLEGGSMPEQYDGMYTDVNRAMAAIKQYLTHKWDEAEQNATGAKG